MVNHICALADRLPLIRFHLHEPTQRALETSGLLQKLALHPNVQMAPLLRYADFVRVLAHAAFVLTDGGSVQEEASYIAKPCLVLRRETERPHGIGTTAKLTSLDVEEDIAFLRSVRSSVPAPGSRPILEASRSVLTAIGALR
jgi:UDP-N-acetylglucosamine 2-epimerase